MGAKAGRKNGKDFGQCDSHTCKKCSRCAHSVRGPAVTGAAQTNINGAPSLRVGDSGVHDKATCCGPNKWEAIATATDHEVFVEGKAIFCVDDITLHDGKDQGKLMVGSDNVFAK